jgi:hypothetical protein
MQEICNISGEAGLPSLCFQDFHII